MRADDREAKVVIFISKLNLTLAISNQALS